MTTGFGGTEDLRVVKEPAEEGHSQAKPWRRRQAGAQETEEEGPESGVVLQGAQFGGRQQAVDPLARVSQAPSLAGLNLGRGKPGGRSSGAPPNGSNRD